MLKLRSRICLLGAVWCLFLTEAQGQNLTQDTIKLDPAIVLGVQEEAYTDVRTSFTARLDSVQNESLTSLLIDHLAVPINQYGARGQLASINLRGLGASRTSLIWNNLEVNSFTNGQTDFNLISSSVGSLLHVQRGVSSSLRGSGALGGAISIRSDHSFGQRPTLSLSQTVGSFGYRDTRFAWRQGTNKWSYALKFNTLAADNDFKYRDRGETFRQNNAAFKALNIQSDLAYLFSSTTSASFNIWYNKNDRQLQPGKLDFSGDDRLEDENWRAVLSFNLDKNRWSGKYQMGYTRDHQVFNANAPLIVNRIYGSAQSEWQEGSFLLRLGANTNHLFAEAESFEGLVQENRVALFGSIKWRLKEIDFIFNARQPIIEGDLKPFSPSLEGNWSLVDNRNESIHLNVKGSRGYRFPTLNDRFWNPGGNPALKSELSTSLESGFSVKAERGLFHFNGQVQYYLNDVDNWIIWIPGGREMLDNGELISFWFPDNVRRVLVQGVEYGGEVNLNLTNKWKVRLNHSATFTRSVNKVALSELDRSVGKQLPFTPKHVASTRLSIVREKFSISVARKYTSSRFPEANNESPPIPAYTLYDVQSSYGWRWNKWDMSLHAAVLNLTNQDYESFINRAMPGINYTFTINLKYVL